MSELYVGPKKVVDNTSLDEKLVTGESLFEVKYEDGSKEILTDRMFVATAKDAPVDATTLRDNRVFPVVARVLELLLNWGLKVDEVDYLMAVLTRSVNSNLQAADAKVWGKQRGEITLMDLDKHLREENVTLKDILPSDEDIKKN